MSTKVAATFLLSSLFYTTRAFVPFNIHPPIDNSNFQAFPSELDPAHWVPIATITPTANTPSIPSPIPTQSAPIQENEYHNLPLGLDAAGIPEVKVDLKARQVTGQSAAANPTELQQISPITTYDANKQVGPGSVVQVQVVYTQTFNPVPDPWQAAVAGTIGLGTITGEVGQVRSKRSEPTQAPLAKNGIKNSEGDNAGVTVIPLEKEGRKEAQPTAEAIKLELFPENDARHAFQAGSLAMLAVGIATMCVSYL